VGLGICMRTIVDANASSKTRFRVFVIVGSVIVANNKQS
jgi:hypothetical protein